MALTIKWLTPDRFDLKPNKSPWLEMAKGLSKHGHNVEILTSKSKTFVAKDSAQPITYVNALDFPLIFRFSVLLNMYFWLKKHANHDDIIIMNQDSLLIAPLLRKHGFKHIHLDIRTIPVDMHTIKDRLDRLLYWHVPLKLFGRVAQSYSFITDRLRQEVENEFDLKITDYAIWQSGVSTKAFFPKALSTIQAKTKFRLFYHGTISVNRGIGLVIEAVSLLDPSIDLEFIIVGDGGGANELKLLAKELHLGDRVIFRGLLPYQEMVNEINQADVCICPLTDRLEWNVSSPLKVFEYMACAKPIILTPISAHKDVADGTSFVIWTDGYKPKDFKQAIVIAIEKQQILNDNAKQAPEIVKNNYEWQSQSEKLETHLIRHITEF